jgi:hypothetical protein
LKSGLEFLALEFSGSPARISNDTAVSTGDMRITRRRTPATSL